METINKKPSYKQGFARHAGDSIAPNMWRGLVSAWSPFLGVTGLNLHDIGPDHNPGTLTSMALSTAWSTHQGEASLEFIEADDYVLVKSSPLASTLAQCTVSAWFSTTTSDTTGGRPMYGEKAATGNDLFKLDYGDDTTQSAPLFTWRNDAGTLSQVRTTGSGFSDGKWHQFTVVVDGTDIRLYVDGFADGTGTISTKNFTDSGLDTRIGGSKSGSTTWLGFIGAITVHDRAFSSNEARELYQLGRGGIFQKRNRIAVLGSAAEAAVGQVTRLGLSATPRDLYGSFAGKTPDGGGGGIVILRRRMEA